MRHERCVRREVRDVIGETRAAHEAGVRKAISEERQCLTSKLGDCLQ